MGIGSCWTRDLYSWVLLKTDDYQTLPGHPKTAELFRPKHYNKFEFPLSQDCDNGLDLTVKVSPNLAKTLFIEKN